MLQICPLIRRNLKLFVKSINKKAGQRWWNHKWSRIQNPGQKPAKVCKDLKLSWRCRSKYCDHKLTPKMQWLRTKHNRVSSEYIQLNDSWQDFRLSFTDVLPVPRWKPKEKKTQTQSDQMDGLYKVMQRLCDNRIWALSKQAIPLS